MTRSENRSAGTFVVTVTLAENRIGKFVAFSRDSTLLRANAKVMTGDVGARTTAGSNMCTGATTTTTAIATR